MKIVFADTFYFLALLNERDAVHLQALEYSMRNLPILTTAWVLTELADASAAPESRAVFLNILQALRSSADAKIVGPSQELFDAGIELFRSRPDKAWSLTDCISFEVMRRSGLTEALTADRHFIQAGFHVLFK